MPALPITFNEYLDRVQYIEGHSLQVFARQALLCPEIARKQSRVYSTLRKAFRDHLPENLEEFKEAWFLYKRETKILHKADLYALTVFCPVNQEAVMVKRNNRTNIDLVIKQGVVVLVFRCPLCRQTHEIQWIEVRHVE